MSISNDFVPREIENPELEKILNSFADGLDSIVDFGSQILKSDFENTLGKDEVLPIIMSLRHFLDLIDAISILIRKSSIDPAKLLLRGALETFLSLEYIFEKNTDQRCMAFMVFHIHHKIKLIEKYDINTESGKQFLAKFKHDRLLNDMKIPEFKGDLDHKKNLLKLLNKPEYKLAEEAYQNLLVTKKPFNWFNLFNGPKNIIGLATHLKYIGLYELLYRKWSSSTHSMDIIDAKIIGNDDGSVSIYQLRMPTDAQSVIQWAISISLRTLDAYIKNRTPNKMEDYKVWHLTIRDLYIRVYNTNPIIRID